jgi:RNA polymerase sigma factor (sigma-70 family)
MPERDVDELEPLASERRLLLRICYRMLGSVADAEDAVQETYARWCRLSENDRGAIASRRAWLVKAASRICLDVLQSARTRRERYVGEWLPEPLPPEAGWGSMEVDEAVELDRSVSMALLVVLETMTPAERVVFVLHDVFGLSFDEASEIVGRSSQACRQLAVSARRRVQVRKVEPHGDGGHADLIAAFKAAWQARDLERIVAMLDPSAAIVTDGGGIVSAALAPVSGPESIAKLLVGAFDRQPGLRLEMATVNGEPGLVGRAGDEIVAVIAFGIGRGLIRDLWVVRNPEKLRRWN